MDQGNSFEVRVWLTEKLYTTLKKTSERYGVTMAMILRATLIVCLTQQLPFDFKEGDKHGI